MAVLCATIEDMSSHQRKTPFVAVNVTIPARDEIRAAALTLTSPENGKVTISEAVMSALRVATRYRDEWERELAAVRRENNKGAAN